MKVACTMTVAAPLLSRSLECGGEPPVRRHPIAAILSKRSGDEWLRHDLFHDVAGNVGEAEVAPLVAVGEPLVIDPQ